MRLEGLLGNVPSSGPFAPQILDMGPLPQSPAQCLTSIIMKVNFSKGIIDWKQCLSQALCTWSEIFCYNLYYQ